MSKVRIRPITREEETQDWQVAGNAWDHVQLRQTYFKPKRDCVEKVSDLAR